MHRYRPYLSLAAILILGTVLRFAQLDGKPVWLDEILTGLFSLGGSYQDIPLDAVLPLGEFADIFTLNSAASCGQIAQTVATESTHPPLFFCLTHEWLSGFRGSWVWQARSLSAWFGVGAIAAMYGLNRIAFSRQAGVMGAAVMAVSPFAVYLSQEARHYTLTMLLIILSLIGFIQIQKDLHHLGKVRPWLGISWAIINTLGLYTHYFFILTLVAEMLTILALLLGESLHWLGEREQKQTLAASTIWLSLAAYSVLPLLFYLPWLPTLHNHFSRPETDWFKPFEPSWVDSVTPIFQTLAGWVVMIVAFPVENQPLWIVISSAILMLLAVGCFLLFIFPRVVEIIKNQKTQLSGLSLLLFTGFVLLEYFAIVYLLGKDITSAVRYHFIYYPGICALLGASLMIKPPNPLSKTHFSILARARWLRPYSPTRTLLANQERDLSPNPSPTSPRPSPTSPRPSPKRRGRIRKFFYCWRGRIRNFFLLLGGALILPLPAPPSLLGKGVGGLGLPLANRVLKGAGAFLIIGLISSVFVVSNWVFQKPYDPAGVAQQLNLEPTVPLVVVVGYENMQEVALGLSFALELDKIRGGNLPETGWAFMKRSPSYQSVWENLAAVSGLPPSAVNLWIVAPGLRQREYPPQLVLGDRPCNLDPSQYYRLGIPYQLYRCGGI